VLELYPLCCLQPLYPLVPLYCAAFVLGCSIAGWEVYVPLIHISQSSRFSTTFCSLLCIDAFVLCISRIRCVIFFCDVTIHPVRYATCEFVTSTQGCGARAQAILIAWSRSLKFKFRIHCPVSTQINVQRWLDSKSDNCHAWHQFVRVMFLLTVARGCHHSGISVQTNRVVPKNRYC